MASTKLFAEIIFGDENFVVSDNIISTNFGALDRGNITELAEYGIYANKGQLSFIDHDKTFNNLFAKYENTTVGKVRFWLGYNVNCIATFNIENAYIDDETRQVDVDLISSLLAWQNIKIYRPLLLRHKRLFEEMTLANIIDTVNEYYNIGLSIRSNRPKLTKIYCPDIDDNTSVWDLMTQICQVGMCMIFEDEYGNPCIYDTMPRSSNIIVNPNNIIHIGNQSKSSIPNANIVAVERTKHIEEQSELKRFSIFDSSGNLVDFQQGADISITGELPDFALVEYDVELRNPTFKVGSVLINGSWYNMDSGKTIDELISPTNSYVTPYPSYRYAFVRANFMSKYASDSTSAIGNNVLTSANISFYSTYYTDDDEKIESYSTSETAQPTSLTANKLLQTNSKYAAKNLSLDILDTVKSRFAKPINCVEMECLLGDYSDKEGNIALSKGQVFKKYDTIIPYVIKNGKKQPYSIDANGNASNFEIVGVEFSYRGLLRQKLYLQENYSVVYDDHIGGQIAAIVKDTNGKTYFPWVWEGLTPNTTYVVSLNINSSIIRDFSVWSSANSGEYGYYTYSDNGFQYYPIAKDYSSLFNFTLEATTDNTGKLCVGICYLDYEVSSELLESYCVTLNEYVNWAVATRNYTKAKVGAHINPHDNKTYFPFWWEKLKPNTTYLLSWSLNNSVFNEFDIYQNDNGLYCYYTIVNASLEYYPISFDTSYVLNQTLKVTSDSNGEIVLGICVFNYEASQNEAYEYMLKLKEHINLAIASDQYIEGRVTNIVEPQEARTYFPWFWRQVEPNTSYIVSWSLKESVFDEFDIYQNEDGYYCYYTHLNGSFNYYPISKDRNSVLNHALGVTTDGSGELMVGVCVLDSVIEKQNAEYYFDKLRKHIDFIEITKQYS